MRPLGKLHNLWDRERGTSKGGAKNFWMCREGRAKIFGHVVRGGDKNEWWVKVSRAVGGAEKSYDFPPHVVRVRSSYATTYREDVDGALNLLDSPWDPINSLLPVREYLSAQLDTPAWLGREITLEGELNPDAFWSHIDTIGGSRWPGEQGGPRRNG